jgi:hypothetical protein
MTGGSRFEPDCKHELDGTAVRSGDGGARFTVEGCAVDAVAARDVLLQTP